MMEDPPTSAQSAQRRVFSEFGLPFVSASRLLCMVGVGLYSAPLDGLTDSGDIVGGVSGLTMLTDQ